MTEQTLPIETFAPRTPLQEFWFYFKQNKGAVIGLTFILAVALISIFAPWIAPFDPIEQNRSALLLPPAWYEGGNSAYLLGTDDIGRDILSHYLWYAHFCFCRFHYCHTILHFRNEPRFACRLLWWRIGYINCSFY